MNKILIIIFTAIVLTGCQRGKLNELSVDFNKSLIIPPIYDLTEPGKKLNKTNENKVNDILIGSNGNISTDESLVKDILNKTNSENSNNKIREQIDYDTGYKNEDGFFQWLLRGGSKREKIKKLDDTVDPFSEN